MNSRRTSKRKQDAEDGGNTSASKKRRSSAGKPYKDTLFTTSLAKSGVGLSDGSLQNTIDVDVSEFQRVLLATLTNHQPDFNQVIGKFIEGLTKYIESYARFHKLLSSTVKSSNLSGGNSIILPSIIRLLLCINELQEGVAKVIIEKLLDFSTEEPIGVIDLAIREVHQIPKLIMNQFRWLDFLVNGKELCDKLLEVTSVLPRDIQRDIIQAIPHIIEDDQHGFVANKLKDICNDNSDLLTTCIDTWSELNMSLELGSEVLDIVMDRVSSADVDDLPVVLNYIFTQKLILKNVVDTIREVRERLDTDSCFIPLPSMTSTPHPNLISQSGCSSGGYVVLDCIQSTLQRLKVVATGWVKVIESIEEESDHKLLDLFILFILHSLPNNSKLIRNLIVNKVKSKKFTESILAQFFENQIPNLRNLFPSVLSIAEHLLCSSSPTVSIFAQKLYKHAFAASDMFKRQDIIATQVSLISSGNTSESNYALEILEDLVEKYPKAVERFTVLIKDILDYLEYLDVGQIRKVYSILSMLAYTINEESDSSLHDELQIIIRKQLHHADETFRHNGVIAAVMAVKQITQQRSDSADGTLFNILNEDKDSLSPTRKQQAKDILKQVFMIINKDSAIGSLFFDEMANVVTTSELHNEILEFIREETTNFFQDSYVIESTSDLSSEAGITMCYSYSLEAACEEGDIAINLLPCIVKYLNEERQGRRTDCHKINILCSNFRLLRILEQIFNNGLSEIDALLGCPIVLPAPAAFEADTFKEFTLEQRQIMCATLFHCINWLRELLSAFAGEEDPEMKGKVLQRLATITELQQTLNKCLTHTPGPIPSVISDTGTKQVKKKTTSKSKTDVTFVAMATTVTATQLENGAKDTASTASDKPLEVTFQSDSLQRLKNHFRELDLSAYKVMTYEPLSHSVLDSNTIMEQKNEIKLEFYQLLFLLQELYQKVSTQFSFFAAKKKTRDKQSSDTDRKLASLMSGTIVPSLCKQLEAINTYFQVHAESNDGVLDSSMDSSNYCLILTCFQLIFKILTTFFNWPLLSDPSYQDVLKESLKCFACRLSQASTQENVTIAFLASKTFNYIKKFIDMIPSIIPAAALCRLLVAIQKITKVYEVKTKTAEYCGRLLKQSWSEADRNSTAQNNEALEYIIKYHIEWSEDPLNTIESIYGDGGIADFLGEESRNQSQTYPTMTLQTISCYYRCMSAAIVNCVKNIPPINKESIPTAEVLLESFQCLQVIVKHFFVLVNLVKSFDMKRMISAALKNGRPFIESFIKNGIPIVDLLFKLRKDEVLSMLKTLQQATRCLQHFCGHSKVVKDVTLTNHVPKLKKCLETLIFRVKEVVINHNCFEAFWVGSLKNRDLQGQIIPSQMSQSVSNDNDEEMETEQEDEDDDNDCASVDRASTSETITSYGVTDDEQ